MTKTVLIDGFNIQQVKECVEDPDYIAENENDGISPIDYYMRSYGKNDNITVTVLFNKNNEGDIINIQKFNDEDYNKRVNYTTKMGYIIYRKKELIANE